MWSISIEALKGCILDFSPIWSKGHSNIPLFRSHNILPFHNSSLLTLPSTLDTRGEATHAGSGAPSAIIRTRPSPSGFSSHRLPWKSVRAERCAILMIVASFNRSVSSSYTCSWLGSSRAEVASSRNNHAGFAAALWRWPPVAARRRTVAAPSFAVHQAGPQNQPGQQRQAHRATAHR